jgi:hypothetical protein
MQQFMRKFTQLNGVRAKVLLKHCLFDRQVFVCNELQTINDDERIGLMLKDQEIFLYKQDVMVTDLLENIYTISDGRLTIIVNKL